MNQPIRVIVAALVLSFGFAAGWAVSAQVQAPIVPQGPTSDEAIISGGDLGFRVEARTADGTPLGKLVVRVDGQWVEPRFSPGLRRLTGQ